MLPNQTFMLTSFTHWKMTAGGGMRVCKIVIRLTENDCSYLWRPTVSLEGWSVTAWDHSQSEGRFLYLVLLPKILLWILVHLFCNMVVIMNQGNVLLWKRHLAKFWKSIHGAGELGCTSVGWQAWRCTSGAGLLWGLAHGCRPPVRLHAMLGIMFPFRLQSF